MPKSITLLDRASADLANVNFILSNHHADELQLDIAAYHIQQTIEKTVKFYLQSNGIVFEKTHDMDKLWTQCEKAELPLPKWIYDNIDILNTYATQTRYGADTVSSLRKITQLATWAKELIAQLAPEETHECSCTVDKVIFNP